MTHPSYIPDVFRCSVCGAEKGKANHWFILFAPGPPLVGRSIEIAPWSENLARMESPRMYRVCGEAHLLKQISLLLPQLTLTAAPRAQEGPQHEDKAAPETADRG